MRDIRNILAGVAEAVIVEVGAALGADTCLYSLLASKVVAYEAGPATAKQLEARVESLQRFAAN